MHYYPAGTLIISSVLWLWETYLDLRQYRVYLRTDKVPKELTGKIDDETFKKTRAYSIDRSRFSILSGLHGQCQTIATIYFFLIPYFWNLSGDIMSNYLSLGRRNTLEWEILQSLIFTFITMLLSVLINLPLSLYSTFVIESRHGFNKQTAGFYAWDKTKQFFVSYTISAPILAVMIYIVRNGGDYFFLYLWMFTAVVVCVLTFFHAEIMAIFDTFTPLSEGELRDKIEELAKSLNFPLKNIFIVENSKRSDHSNAYQSGIFNRKRIVIYDTLIENYQGSKGKISTDTAKKSKGCKTEEILAILCHELGHWYHGHLIKNLIFSQLNFLCIFTLFSKFYQDQTFFAAFGFENETPIIIGLALVMMLFTPINEISSFVAISMTRYFEYQSDAFAKKKGYGEHLKQGLIKIHSDNLGFPVHDRLYSLFNLSHPSLIQRISALSKTE